MALSSSLVSLGIFVGIYALLALGLNIKFGYAGLLDIGHVAFYLVGAYVTALLVLPAASEQQFAQYVLGLNWPWLPAIAVGTIVAGILGMLVALPAIRLREDYLAIAVLGISVIVKRIVQSEGWLANGPDSLRGFQPPFQPLFPLPGEGVPSALIFGGVAFVLWATGTFILARMLTEGTGRRLAEADGGDLAEIERAERGVPGGIGGKFVHGLFALTTLGVGYFAARRAGADAQSAARYAVGAGLVVGVAATAAAIAVPGVSTLLFMGAFSTFTWVLAGVALVRHYERLDRRDAVVAFGLALAFIGAFVPIIVLGGGSGQGQLGLVLTIALLVAFVYGLYRLGSGWEWFDSSTAFVQLVGLAAVWLFVVRYFLLSLITPLQQGGVGFALQNMLQNVLWLARFNPSAIVFDYPRFLLILTFAVVGVAYYLLEVTVKSPFGRVLKAIREDEDVATAIGKNTFAFKVQSMILGSALAGLAGGLTAMHFKSLVHTMFEPRITFIAFLILIIGGTANNKGMILGAVIYWGFQKGTEDIASFFPPGARASVQALRLAFIGALLIVILYYRPEGLWGEERLSVEVEE